MDLVGKILVVDDEKITLDFFDITLSKLGFDTIKAVSGEEALEKVLLYTPDLLLLDNILPKMSGIEVTKKIRNEKKYSKVRDIPIIMFSAITDPNEKVLSFEMGVDDYITKPFNFSEVLARIRSVFRHKKLTEKVMKKERRLAAMESLNTNLIAFTRHIKKPLEELFHIANTIKLSDNREVENFINKVKDEYKETLALINSLEDEILELKQRTDDYGVEDFSLEKLEERINNYIRSGK